MFFKYVTMTSHIYLLIFKEFITKYLHNFYQVNIYMSLVPMNPLHEPGI